MAGRPACAGACFARHAGPTCALYAHNVNCHSKKDNMCFDEIADPQPDLDSVRPRCSRRCSDTRSADKANPARHHLLDPFRFPRVIYCMQDVISQFPARRLTPDEHALVVEWLAAAGDVASAYVSNRRSDDPALHHRIIIAAGPGGAPSHFVHASSGRDIWIVFSSGRRTRIRRYQTLRAALNSIRPVLVDAGSPSAAVKSKATSSKRKRVSSKPKVG